MSYTEAQSCALLLTGIVCSSMGGRKRTCWRRAYARGQSPVPWLRWPRGAGRAAGALPPLGQSRQSSPRYNIDIGSIAASCWPAWVEPARVVTPVCRLRIHSQLLVKTPASAGNTTPGNNPRLKISLAATAQSICGNGQDSLPPQTQTQSMKVCQARGSAMRARGLWQARWLCWYVFWEAYEVGRLRDLVTSRCNPAKRRTRR